MIGEKIKLYRIQKGLSQEDIAKHLSMSQSAYAKVEKGITKLGIDRFLKIADYLETDPYELLMNQEGKVFNYNNSKINNGYVENLYAEQKEVYESILLP